MKKSLITAKANSHESIGNVSKKVSFPVNEDEEKATEATKHFFEIAKSSALRIIKTMGLLRKVNSANVQCLCFVF
jgi:hypothetical protein